MEFFKKIEQNPYQDLLWNIPEQKWGVANIVGGNAQNFRTPVKVAEIMTAKCPVKEVRLVLPDVLKGKLPELPNLVFLESTESGSLASGEELAAALEVADFNLLIGDLSKNSITGKAIVSACESSATGVENEISAYHSSAKPVLITRDTVDILAENCTENTLMNGRLILMGSLAQLIKVFRAIYYPKMVTLSQSLVQLAEALHKFTLSYPVKLITLHNGQILIAAEGKVVAVPLEKTGFSPLSLWMGEGAVRVTGINLYNPGRFVEATVAGLMGTAGQSRQLTMRPD